MRKSTHGYILMDKVFNTVFEMSLRLLLLLAYSSNGLTIDQAAAFDFIAVYGNIFGISASNLHGDNNLIFSEYPFRRQATRTALKSMVLNGWVTVKDTGSGFLYTLTANATTATKKINNAYSVAYRSSAQAALNKYGSLKEEQLVALISKASTQALRR